MRRDRNPNLSLILMPARFAANEAKSYANGRGFAELGILATLWSAAAPCRFLLMPGHGEIKVLIYSGQGCGDK
jgi:hypothetical protein